MPPAQAAELARVNKPGLTALREYLATGQAVAFLGAGVSAPLYPLWTGLIGELVDAAAGRLDDRQAESLRALASQSPEEVVEIVRTALGAGAYREVAAPGAAGADRPGDGTVLDAGAGAGLPVRVHRRWSRPTTTRAS